VSALSAGTDAPAIPGVDLGGGGPLALFFYKVTCPVCQMAGPNVQAFEEAYPGRIVGIGQDPPEALGRFEAEHAMTFDSVPDLPPYDVSNAYGIEVVPTLFLVDGAGTVRAVAESWDREGFNEISRRLGDLLGKAYRPISVPGDGLPAFRPG
jgi:peroxiredoxin